jgi:undecaprenyl-diphosphatase
MRIALAWMPFLATFVSARSRKVAAWEHVSTRRLNQLPEVLHYPLWAIMQSGSAAAPVVAGATALAVRQPVAARRLAASGLTAYVLAKGVKRIVRRPRPEDVVVGVRIRGRPAGGHGYVSGHAAVSMALAVEAAPLCSPAARTAPWAGACVVALSRIYVGAHLPLDALGGSALGWAISKTASELRRPARSDPL